MAKPKQAIDDLFNPKLSIEEALDLHFSPGFRQRINGSWIDRSSFLAGIVQFRESIEQAGITVLDEFEDGARYAERHVTDLLKCDGERVLQEVSVFARLDPDGRFAQIEETTLLLGKESH